MNDSYIDCVSITINITEVFMLKLPQLGRHAAAMPRACLWLLHAALHMVGEAGPCSCCCVFLERSAGVLRHAPAIFVSGTSIVSCDGSRCRKQIGELVLSQAQNSILTG